MYSVVHESQPTIDLEYHQLRWKGFVEWPMGREVLGSEWVDVRVVGGRSWGGMGRKGCGSSSGAGGASSDSKSVNDLSTRMSAYRLSRMVDIVSCVDVFVARQYIFMCVVSEIWETYFLKQLTQLYIGFLHTCFRFKCCSKFVFNLKLRSQRPHW